MQDTHESLQKSKYDSLLPVYSLTSFFPQKGVLIEMGKEET